MRSKPTHAWEMLSGRCAGRAAAPQASHRRIMVLGIGLVGVSTAALALIRVSGGAGAAPAAGGGRRRHVNVSRHAYIADMTRRGRRGRAISLFGGTNRLGRFVGPGRGRCDCRRVRPARPLPDLWRAGLCGAVLLLALRGKRERAVARSARDRRCEGCWRPSVRSFSTPAPPSSWRRRSVPAARC